jgi:fimbrial chaperone protein
MRFNEVRLRICFLVLTVLAYMGLAPGTWAASSILIWPINPSIDQDAKATALWLENRGTQPVDLQIRVLQWKQTGFDDQLTPQQSVVGSPPFATVQPGKRQMIRLMRMQPVPAGSQQSFRVLVDELLPDAQQQASQNSVQFQMRYSVPLFVYGQGVGMPTAQKSLPPGIKALLPELTYRIGQEGQQRFLYLTNHGNAHARLAQVQLQSTEGAGLTLADGLLGYVLPGAQMRWRLPQNIPTGRLLLQARVDDGADPVAISQE